MKRLLALLLATSSTVSAHGLTGSDMRNIVNTIVNTCQVQYHDSKGGVMFDCSEHPHKEIFTDYENVYLGADLL